MTSEEFRYLIPQYLADQLSIDQLEAFEAQMSASPELQNEVDELRWLWNGLGLLTEPQPSPALRARFYQRLNAVGRERASASISIPKWVHRWLPQLAFGAAVFLVGIYVGHIRDSGRAQTEELTQMRSEVQNLQQMVALSLLERQSATSRLEGVAWTDRIQQPDNRVMNALITTMNHDPNVNVRLSSLDALTRFSDEAVVRKALVDSVASQDSPLVQIALIDELVQIRERNAAQELRTLSVNAKANTAVRQRAQWGLTKLGYE
jgi:hypothetical protein